MRITVFGASGGTGQLLVKQAAAHGHHVTAVVRNPNSVMAFDPATTVRRADVLDPESLTGTTLRADAVISVLGPRDGRQPTTVYSEGTANIMQDMRATGARRLLVISAVPASPPGEKSIFERYILHPILWRFFGPSYTDLRRMEAELRETADVDWTIVRPPRLTDGGPTGRYRSAVDSRLAGAKRISRGDLAAALLTAAADKSLVRRVVTVSI